MKRSLLIIGAVVLSFAGNSQSTQPQTLNATGGHTLVGTLHLEWSVGEMVVVQTLVSPGMILTQGLLQPFTGAAASLPVTLLYFKGKTVNNEHVLHWATAQEINNHHFNVERSANGTAFELFKQVAGAGNSSVTHTYNLVDPAPYPDTYYRLQQVDADGRYSYSAVIRLQLTHAITIGIYPNPTSSILNLSYNGGNRPLQITIFDVAGKPVLKRIMLSTGTMPIDVQALSKGMYFIKASDPQAAVVWSAPFIKQ